MQQADDDQPIQYITPDQPGGIPGWREGIPVIRLYTCGLLSIEILQEVPDGDPTRARYKPIPADQLRGAGPAPACKLLKLLTSRPERYASKDGLMTHLREGKNADQSITPRRLENIVSTLRKLVRLPSGKRLRDLLTYGRATHESGDGYQLASYPLVWVDADALAWNVKQACLKERFRDDAFPYWLRAYALASRGPFLLDEPHSDWAKKRRREVYDHSRQSIHALTRLYLKRYGEAAEEEVIRILTAYRRSHPADEDLVRPLLHVLVKRGRYNEVLDYYEALERGLAARGLTNDGSIRTPGRLTKEIVEYARLKLREGTAAKPVQGEVIPFSILQSDLPQRDETLTFFSRAVTQGIRNAIHELMSQEQQFDSAYDLHEQPPVRPSLPPYAQDIMKEGDLHEVEGQDMDRLRRRLLQLGASVTGTLLSTTAQDAVSSDLEIVKRFVRALEKPSTVDTLFLTHLEATTRNNRKRFVLSKNSAQDIRFLYHDISAHLLTITQLLEYALPSQFSRHLCTLAGETTQLLGDICFHEGNTARANVYYDTALKAAEEGQNEVLQAVILGRKSFLPLYSGNAKEALPLLHQAHALASRSAQDLICAWLMVVEAEVQARLGNAWACEKALEQGEMLLSRSHPGFSTCSFSSETSYAPLNAARMPGYQGACYLRLRQPHKAQALLHPYLESSHAASQHRRSITLIDLAKTYALQGEMEEMYHYADQALCLLEQTRSPQVVQRMVGLRQELHQWQETACIKQLDEHLAAITQASTP